MVILIHDVIVTLIAGFIGWIIRSIFIWIKNKINDDSTSAQSNEYSIESLNKQFYISLFTGAAALICRGYVHSEFGSTALMTVVGFSAFFMYCAFACSIDKIKRIEGNNSNERDDNDL